MPAGSLVLTAAIRCAHGCRAQGQLLSQMTPRNPNRTCTSAEITTFLFHSQLYFDKERRGRTRRHSAVSKTTWFVEEELSINLDCFYPNPLLPCVFESAQIAADLLNQKANVGKVVLLHAGRSYRERQPWDRFNISYPGDGWELLGTFVRRSPRTSGGSASKIQICHRARH